MNKVTRIVLTGLGVFMILIGLALVFNLIDQPVSDFLSFILRRPAKPSWPLRFHQVGMGICILGSITLLLIPIIPMISKLMAMIQAFDLWLDQKIGKLPPSGVRPAQADRWPTFSRLDGLILSLFLIYALLLFLGVIQDNYPNMLLKGDAGNTASFAAGFDHPELFQGDMLLNDPKNIMVYSTFNVFFMRLLFPLLKSYTLAFAILIPIQIFFNLTGFYLFGRILFGSRLWGIALTTLLSIPVLINLGESWGISIDPVARFNFQAFLPFILCMVLVWRSTPARWPWIMAALGIMFYLHPVSTPCWGATIWLSLFFMTPREWNFWKRMGYMIAMGLIFVAVAMPYVVTYLSNHVQGKSQNYNLVYTTIINYFPENLLNVPAALGVFIDLMVRNGILPGAILGLAVTLVLRRTNRDPLKISLIWVSGIVLMSVVVPFVTHTYEQTFGLIPMETEMVRAIRYTIPFMLLFILWGIYEISLRVRIRAVLQTFLATGMIVILVSRALLTGPTETLQKAVSCLFRGQFICINLSDYDLVLQAVKTKVPEGAPIYVTFANRSILSYGMPLRYIAMRPLVYTFKDRGLLVYSNDEALRTWNAIYQQSNEIDHMYRETPEKLDMYLDVAKKLGARYLIADTQENVLESLIDPLKLKIIYRNNQFVLIQID